MATCCICILELIPNDIEKCRVCNQGFHNECICNWIAEHDTCPHCRSTMYGNMLLNNKTIIHYFTKIKTSNRLIFDTDANIDGDIYTLTQLDNYPRLITMIQPPSTNLHDKIKHYINIIKEHRLERLFNHLLIVPTLAKLECHSKLRIIIPQEPDTDFDEIILYVFIAFRNGGNFTTFN